MSKTPIFEDSANDAILLLKNMITLPSFSKEEGKVADMLERYIELKGYTVLRKGNNLWLMSTGFDLAKPTILLNSHIDTVKPVAGWTRDPFIPVVKDNKLYGLGSNDAGASVVTLLHAFFELTEREQSYNLIYSATAEEENSGSGGVESLLPELPPISFALVGEPTGMHPAVAEKGLMVLDCVAYGKAGHAARNEGENAIYIAMDDIHWFRNFTFPAVSEYLGPVKMTVTQMNAGSQHNVVPDRCNFVVDVRTNELYTNQELLQKIKQHARSEVTARTVRLCSTATPANHPVVQRAIELNRIPYGSPTLSDQALMNFPSVKMGPGDSARSHTANEYILIDEIEKAIPLYVKLLDGLNLL